MGNEVCIVHEGAIAEAPAAYAARWGTRTPLLVADRNTWAVAGARLRDAFAAAGTEHPQSFVFADQDPVYADDDHVAQVRRLLEGNDLIAVAVGSGTINDLVKLAAHECGKDYMVVATAPSVDGFTAYGAAITVKGFKTTLPCPPPAIVVGDTAILGGAPNAMIASGYGDLSAKLCAGADWQIADALGVERIDPEIWGMVQGPLRMRLSDPAGLARRKPETVEGLFLGLAQVGYAMQRYKDSRPASGAEHLMSHVWEMEHLRLRGEAVSHGFKVAVGALASTALMTELLSLSEPDVERAMTAAEPESWARREKRIETLFPADQSREGALAASRKKFLETGALGERRKTILANWSEIRKRVGTQIVPFGQLQRMFRAAGCPYEPAHIGLDKAGLERGIRKAQGIRARYTVLDLAYEAGLLDRLAAKVSADGAYFTDFLE